MSRHVIFDDKCFPYKDKVVTLALHSPSTDVKNIDTVLPPTTSIPSPNNSHHPNPITLPHHPTQTQPLPTPNILPIHTPPHHPTCTLLEP